MQVGVLVPVSCENNSPLISVPLVSVTILQTPNHICKLSSIFL